MVQISFKLTEKEIYKGLVETSRSRFITRLMRGFGFFLVAGMLFFTTNSLANGTYVFSFTTSFPLFLGIYLLFLSEITARLQTPNLVKTKNPFSEKVNVRLDRSGFRISGDSFNTQLAWDKFLEIVETDDFYLLKATEGTANVLPKRAFSEEEKAEFKSLVSAVDGLKLKLK
jgi:hypothetical protein